MKKNEGCWVFNYLDRTTGRSFFQRSQPSLMQTTGRSPEADSAGTRTTGLTRGRPPFQTTRRLLRNRTTRRFGTRTTAHSAIKRRVTWFKR